MNTALKHSTEENIILPLPPTSALEASDMELYARFMRHLRNVPNSRMEIKILSAIQFTADILDHSDAHISKTLVDLGLRAPRVSFPADFLKFADQSLMRGGWEVGGPSASLQDLKSYWDSIGEGKFAAFRGDYSLVNEQLLATSF
jgi:hypothetical protein